MVKNGEAPNGTREYQVVKVAWDEDKTDDGECGHGGNQK